MRNWNWKEKLDRFWKASIQELMPSANERLAIDLGAATTRIYQSGHGVVVNEPSAIAFDPSNEKVAAVGQKAYRLLRRKPRKIQVLQPIKDGVISDCEAAGRMLSQFISQAFALSRPTGLSFLICVPAIITPLEQRAYEDAASRAGAKKVTLIEEPYAAAIGADFKPHAECACMIVDIGAATTDVAVISGEGLLHASTRRVGGAEIDRAVRRYLQLERTLEVSEETAEEIKIKLGGVYAPRDVRSMAVRGRNLKTGLPEEITVGSEEIQTLIRPTLRLIKQHVRAALEEIPTQASVDLLDSGIILSGGLSQLDGLAEDLHQELGLQVRVASDPALAAVLGAGHLLENEAEASFRDAIKERESSRIKWTVAGQ